MNGRDAAVGVISAGWVGLVLGGARGMALAGRCVRGCWFVSGAVVAVMRCGFWRARADWSVVRFGVVMLGVVGCGGVGVGA